MINSGAWPMKVSPLMPQLERRLPATVPVAIRSEPDYYGASGHIARALALSRTPQSFATWRHGWIHAPVQHAEQIVIYGKKRHRHLVVHEQHAQFLRLAGYRNVTAVGMPFIYADIAGVERIPNSLLAMPPHSLPYTDHSWGEAAYIEYLQSLRSRYEHIIVCVHPSCVEKGIWVPQLEKAGIRWISGASLNDQNALLRMQILFRSFETLTTNAIGSHVIYAAYAGCKVSISGPYAEYRAEDFAKDPFYLKYPHILAHDLKYSSEQSVNERYPGLCVEPHAGKLHTAWAAHELGAAFRKAPQEMRRLLGWTWPMQLRHHAVLRAKSMIKSIWGSTEK
jgi:hypothetical protein